MTRREWLATVFGASVAAAVAPLVDLTDTTTKFWSQPAILEGFKGWRISFPDGTIFTFDAFVKSERVLSNGSVEMELQPTGQVQVTHEVPKRTPSEFTPAMGTTVEREGQPIADLQEIHAPQMTRDEFELDGDFIPGLKKMGPMTFTMNFLPNRD